MTTELTPDLAQAQVFLDALEPGGEFFFQTFDDHKKARAEVGLPERKHLIKILSGTLEKHAAQLQRLNEAGAGIYVMVNAGRGRKASDVDYVRSYFVDLDGAPVEPLNATQLPPDILVESSPGKYHGYWLTAECPLDQFKARQHALACRFGGDHSVCDLSRVMRLPGFYHRKADEPVMVKLLRCPVAA